MKPSVSSYIKSQVPEFIRSDNPVFVKLLESYYEFLEQPTDSTGSVWSPIGFLRAAIEQKDVDLATEVFSNYIKLQVLPSLPQNELDRVDANTLIKHIKELVSVKGTLDSYRYTMQAIYDQNVDTEVMADYVFRASDNKYESKTIIVVKNLPGQEVDLLQLIGSSLVQQSPIAAAFVDRVQKVTWMSPDLPLWAASISVTRGDRLNIGNREYEAQNSGTTDTDAPTSLGTTIVDNDVTWQLISSDYYTCTLRQDTIFGEFILGGKITGKFRETGESVIVQIDNILGDVSIESPGSLYKPGQELTLTGGSGINGQILVDEVSPGGVTNTIIAKRGYGHQVGDNINFLSVDGYGTGALAEVTAIDGIDANLLPVLELDSFTFRSVGDYYKAGDLIELVLPGDNVNPVLQVDTITTGPATVTIEYGGTYTRAQVMFIDDGTDYYPVTATIHDGAITYIPVPDVAWIGEPVMQVGGAGAYGSLVTQAGGSVGSTYVGSIATTDKGINYTQCPVARFFLDAGFTQPIETVNLNVDYVPSVTDELGIDSLTFKNDTILGATIFKGVAAGTTIYFRLECQTGSGFVGSLQMGGKIATASIYRRGDLDELHGDIISYNIPTRLFGTTKVNESAVVDAEYRLKNILIDNSGRGYTVAESLIGFTTTNNSAVIQYPAGELLSSTIVKADALVVGTGVPDDTYVVSVDSNTSFTVSNNATIDDTGVTLSFGGYIVSVTEGKGTGAVLEPLIVQDAVASVTIVNGGTLYGEDTTIQVISKYGNGAVLRPVISAGVITGVTIVDCGEGYTNSDLVLVTSKTGSGAQLSIVTADGVIRAIRLLSSGEGYQSGVTLTITGDGASATATPTITDGVITRVSMTNRGSGYTTASVTINVLGVDAEVSIQTSPNGVIKNINVDASGEGYWDPTEITPLTVTVSAPTNPSLVAGGGGYVSGGTFVSIVGDGTGAAAVANVRNDGVVMSVTMTSIGKNYTYADVVITGAGTGAHGIARVVNGAVTEIAIVSGKLAKLAPTINKDSGEIEVLEILDPGFGYVVPPTITINGGTPPLAGSVTNATVNVTTRQLTGFDLSGGAGYHYGTQIVIDGDGSNAAATPIVETGITRLDIIDGGETFTAPKALVYEEDNATAKVKLNLKEIDAKVKKFIGRNGVGTFLAGDIIFVGVSALRSIKRGVVVKVEGTTTNPVIHYYLQDSYPVQFGAGDYIQCERSAGVHCVAGLGEDAILEANYVNGKITSVYIVNGGTGYPNNSTIEFINMDGAGATATIKTDPLQSDTIVSATVTNGGTGYINSTITVINEWNSGDTYNTGEEVWYGDYQYQAVAGGTAGATPPTHTTGTVSDGAVDWLYLGPKGVMGTVQVHANTNMDSDLLAQKVSGVIGSYDIVEAGALYVTPSIVVYNNPGDAEVEANLLAGAVDSFTITKNGVYSTAPTIYVVGDGAGAGGTTVLASDGTIDSITITPGSGYTWAHAYVATNVGRNAVIQAFADRPIKSVEITNAGTGYNYTFLSVIGDGTAAALSANIAGFGSVTDASVDTQGTKYTQFPTVIVDDVSAIGAISEITIRDKGYGYTTLPLAVIENNDGASAVIAVSNTIGAVKGFNTTDFGFNYKEVPLVSFPLNLIVSDMTYPFMVGELVYVDGYNYPDNDFTKGPHAYVKEVDLDRNLVVLGGTTDIYILTLSAGKNDFLILSEKDSYLVNEISNYIGIGNVIVGERTRLKTRVLWQNRASGVVGNAAVGKYKAVFSKSSGYLSNTDIVLHDSYRYHDYAYKVSTGLSLSDYEQTLKSLVHPSGFKLFGDIVIEGYGSATVDMPTTDTGEQISDVTYLLLFSLYASLYLGAYVGYISELLWLRVSDITPYIIKELASGNVDLSSLLNKLRRGRVNTQLCKFMDMTNPGTLTFVDDTLTNTIAKTSRVAVGSGYSSLTTTVSINTSTGSGAILEAIVSNGEVVAINVVYGGANYNVADTLTISGVGVGANYTLSLANLAITKMTRSVGSWMTDSFGDDCSRFTVNNHSMMIHRDLMHQPTATDMWVKYEVLSPISGIFTSATYTWAADLVTVSEVAHGLFDGQIVFLSFTSGGLNISQPFVITKINDDSFSVEYLGSGTGGNVTVERSFGTKKFI